MCDPLGKNLLLPSWFAEDLYFASSLGIFFFFFFLYCLNVLRFI